MVDSSKLTALFEECMSVDGLNDNQKISTFIVKAKKIFPDVTMTECKKITGHTSEDEKQNINLSQAFRNNVLIPTRLYITQKMFNLSANEAAEVWKKENNENEKIVAMREKVSALLPARSRTIKITNKMEFLNDILGL